MAEEIGLITLIALAGGVLLLMYLYIAGIGKALEKVGLSRREAGAIVTITLLLGWIPIPLFPYNGWWVAISLGGGAIPLAICYMLMRSRRAPVAESLIGVIIVTTITYFVTRAEEGVGIVADVPFAFAPSVAAGLYALSVFWLDVKKAAPLAYVSGILGTIIGADVFRLGELLSLDPGSEGTPILVIGGATIFDMVYITGIVAIFVAAFVLWLRHQQQKRGLSHLYFTVEHGEEDLPYATDVSPAPTLRPRMGRLEGGSPPAEGQAPLPEMDRDER
ncbi:MAG: DUF1614 domain-containing protein [Thermoplasmata archaeon]|nr:DUF1614 domain-containing protein [Thermoplasmata archaeon]